MAKITPKTTKAANAENMEWTYAQSHLKQDAPLTFLEVVRIDGEPWFLVNDVVRFITNAVSNVHGYLVHGHEVEKEMQEMRMITSKETGETRRFISHDEFGRLFICFTMSYVA